MLIGVPREIKCDENRVAVTPGGVQSFVKNGHRVLVEKSAGEGSGFLDEQYSQFGAEIIEDPSEIYSSVDLVVKVKEPQDSEYKFLRSGLIIFTYFHLGAAPELAEELLRNEIIGISYDTVQKADGSLPLLAPMSEVAGKMAVQIGAHYLEKPSGGVGILLGGVPGVPPAHVVIIGGGTVGINAARVALGMGARVSIFDIDTVKLRYIDDIFDGRVNTVMSNHYWLEKVIADADLLIGAVLIPGSRAPHIVGEDLVKSMKPKSVVIDVAIDQGGCIETCSMPTTHSDPVREKYGVIHYSVANIPGAVPRTATLALTNATLPYALEIADLGFGKAVETDSALARGVNTCKGKIVHKAVASSLGLQYTPLRDILVQNV
ncbi:MAG: alanine dehydrogenase [Bacillota bacterium]|nr:alanine dehydrogenase [Bacillota bacterium]